MKLSQHDLQQLDEDAVRRLPEERLRALSLTLLADLKEARERLAQNPSNSSRPPSSRAPWERSPPGADAGPKQTQPKAQIPGAESDQPPGDAAEAPTDGAEPTTKRRPGKQPGTPGVGRTQRFTAHATEVHRPAVCACCRQPLAASAAAVAYTGFQSLDLQWGDPAAPGLRLWVVDHRYLQVACPCGHHTRAAPAEGAGALALERVQVHDWRLVGPGPATLIVALNLRFRLSRARIQEWLEDWLGIHLGIGTIHQTLHEAAAAVAPAEEQLFAELQTGGLLHADETSWPRHGEPLWLWVFLTTTTTLYVIAGRGKATVSRLLAGFTGWLMSDGWFSYRGYPRRLRCWAHLLRKAQGLVECYDPGGRAFGHLVRTTLEALMAAVYAARESPPPEGGPVDPTCARDLERLRRAVIAHLGHRHEKTKALAVELFNDWDAIFRVLDHPELPLTNNRAEQALRHWVIARRLSHGTRTAVGSRAFTLLASVIDTCRQRHHSPWTYLVNAISDRRRGLPLAPMPQPGV